MNKNTSTPDQSEEIITIPCRVGPTMFRDFAMFDTLIRQKRLRSPIIFFCIMGFFALICYVFRAHADQAVLMGNVLLGIGILLPVGYLLNFYLSVRAQAKKLKLDPPRLVYTLNFTRAEDGITVTSPNTSEGTLRLNWSNLLGAWRVKGAIYFYSSERQAFLLPDGQATVSADALWEFLSENLPAEKLHDRRHS